MAHASLVFLGQCCWVFVDVDDRSKTDRLRNVFLKMAELALNRIGGYGMTDSVDVQTSLGLALQTVGPSRSRGVRTENLLGVLGTRDVAVDWWQNWTSWCMNDLLKAVGQAGVVEKASSDRAAGAVDHTTLGILVPWSERCSTIVWRCAARRGKIGCIRMRLGACCVGCDMDVVRWSGGSLREVSQHKSVLLVGQGGAMNLRVGCR